MKNYNLKKKCRICSSENLQLVLDLGKQPPANALLDEKQLSVPEDKFPLRLFWCSDCFLVQLLDIVSKESLFKNYLYMTSASKPIITHFSQYAKDIFNKFLSDVDDPFVVEIGSNDGSLLAEFKKLGVSILGIEPASNLAKFANESNITTMNNFFSSEIAKEITKSKNVSIVVANNVIGHVENLHDLMTGIKILIGNNGIFIFEIPYLVDLIKKLEFDTIYHEHLSYYSLLPLIHWTNQFGLEIFDIQKQNVHGGSLRIFVSQKNKFKVNDSVKKFIDEEYKLGLDSIEIYHKFSANVNDLKENLKKLLNQLKKENKSIFGYGAPAKGNVLLNYCNIDTEILEFIIDTTTLKQGRYTPGTHIPVISPEKVMEKGKDDVALLLAWNYENEILEKEQSFRKQGGKFLVPIPKPRLL